jgi:hypothetical protein
MRFFKLLAFLILLPLGLFSTELKPWLDTDFQIRAKGNALLQYYREVYSPHESIRYHNLDQFYTLSGSVAIPDLVSMDMNRGIGVELEMTLANTRRQHPNLDNIRLTGRYQFLDDIIGDPISLTAGLTVTQAFKNALFDISSFHHGLIEAEATIAFGKECSYSEFWDSRWWGLLGCGIGDWGTFWLHGYAAWEKNWCDCHQLRFFMNSLYGFGQKNINRCDNFHGYGKIKHRSVDIGVRYSYFLDYGQSLSIQYAFRPYAYNFPTFNNTLEIAIIYPFGL